MTLIAQSTLTVKSSAFKNNEAIPAKFTCDGSNINPAITIEDVPSQAKSLALIMDDPDAPNGTFVHWVMWNISPKDAITEDSAPGAQGKNNKGENKYHGPCPPSGTHHYHFKVYALDIKPDLPVSTDKSALLRAMDGHILAQGELVGTYKRNNQ